MTWTTVKCRECGEAYEVQMYGKRRDREWRVQSWQGVCDECREQKRALALAEARNDATESGLPALEGSEKQVTWAMTIRHEKLEAVRALLESLEKAHVTGLAWDALCGTEAARWWIDNRFQTGQDLFDEALAGLTPQDGIAPPPETDAEATLCPDEPVTATVCEIRMVGTALELHFPEKRDAFRELARDHGYRWTGNCWTRTIGPRQGAPLHRMAEIGHRLLEAGFIIRVYDEETLSRAETGTYDDEITRWVDIDPGEDRFTLTWGRHDDYYREARRLPGSRWRKPVVTVPGDQFEEVQGFAEVQGFTVTPEALSYIEAMRAARLAARIAELGHHEAPEPGKPADRPDLVAEELGILTEFLDDGAEAMSEMRARVKESLAKGKKAEKDEDGDFIDRNLSREFGYALNLYMSDKGYAADAFSWPLNAETREYFDLWREFFGEYPEAALYVLKKGQK